MDFLSMSNDSILFLLSLSYMFLTLSLVQEWFDVDCGSWNSDISLSPHFVNELFLKDHLKLQSFLLFHHLLQRIQYEFCASAFWRTKHWDSVSHLQERPVSNQHIKIATKINNKNFDLAQKSISMFNCLLFLFSTDSFQHRSPGKPGKKLYVLPPSQNTENEMVNFFTWNCLVCISMKTIPTTII